MSASPTKEATPASDAKASDAKASDTKPLFTEKEERILKLAWQCLKSGPPDVDIAKLQKLAEFNTTKTATNTWGVIKKKLAAMAVPATIPEGGGGDKGDGGATPKTPKTPKAKATPKKRGKKTDDDGDDEEAGAENGSPKKKPRKTPVKKGKKATEAEADGEAAVKGENGDAATDVKMEGGDDD